MMKATRSLAVLLVWGCVTLTAVTAASEEDLDSISIALGPRAEALVLARCSVCHSADLITQQRLPLDRWEATVEKMQHWGAELSSEEATLLVRYLSARYHPGAPDRLPPLEHEVGPAEPLEQLPIATGPVVGVAGRGAGIFEHNCQACHGQAGIGGVGPKLAKNPILKHDDLFWETVIHGRGPMPAWGSVLSEQDIADIHAWLLTR
jgi:cytochrome c oxidase cbb3-type subunit 3